MSTQTKLAGGVEGEAPGEAGGVDGFGEDDGLPQPDEKMENPPHRLRLLLPPLQTSSTWPQLPALPTASA